MKYSIILTTVIATLVVSSQLVFAGTIADEYISGETLTATKMNEIRDAVNDNDNNTLINSSNITINDGLITDITTQTQNLDTGCISGSSIRAVASDGTISCEVDNNTGTAGIEYGSSTSQQIATSVNTTCNTFSDITSITVSAPSTGYISVSASGEFCAYTGGTYAMLVLDNASGGTTYDSMNYSYTRDALNRACGIGQFDRYHFQNVYPVAAGTYTYYLKGCTNTGTADGILHRRPMIGQFFPNKY
jgi:hypothetical protein